MIDKLDCVIRAIDMNMVGYEDICKLNEVRQYLEHITEKSNKWISVDDRLPELVLDNGYCNDNVLVCSEKGNIDVMGVAELLETMKDDTHWSYKVFTHWQPLPVAPEGE
jgi:hypothetical protein